MNLQASRPVIDKVFDFAALPDAFRYLQSGAHFGKICVEW
ncbi:zinc-binding dehydrogenase [Klebsiella quasipneumoniae]